MLERITTRRIVWKKKVRSLFREKIQSALQEQYDFYAMS